jgi:hypothetical protein
MENASSTISRLFAAVDARDWQQVEAVMDDKVLIDYTSMSGGSPSWLAPRQITDAWAAFLPGFDLTNHEIFDIQSSDHDDSTQFHFKGRAEHFIGKESWVVEGTYDALLVKKEEGWKVSQFKFKLQGQTGNTQLPALATERMRNVKLQGENEKR